MSTDMANFALKKLSISEKQELLSRLQLNRQGSTPLEIVSPVK